MKVSGDFSQFLPLKLNDTPPFFSQNAFHYGGISEVVEGLEVVK